MDPTSIDANQALVSLKLSQNKNADAAQLIQTVYAQVKHIRDKARERTVIDEIMGNEIADSEGHTIALHYFWNCVLFILFYHNFCYCTNGLFHR